MLVTTQEAFLNIDKTAAALVMPPHALRGQAAARIVPGFKVGKDWRFRVSHQMVYAETLENTVEAEWKSTCEAKRGGKTSRSEQSELENLLGRKIGGKRNG